MTISKYIKVKVVRTVVFRKVNCLRVNPFTDRKNFQVKTGGRTISIIPISEWPVLTIW